MRKRRAPRAASQSDVTRFRGVAIAAVLAAFATAAIAFTLSSPDARRGSPGPLPRPHRLADLACDSCHTEAPMSQSCTGCHGSRDSTRAAHRQLLAGGGLACADCHAGHGASAGVAFLADGRALRYGGGGEAAVAGTHLFSSRAALTVPIVPLAACSRCHDPASPRDPIAACLISGQESLGAARPTVCFDEHRAAGDEAIARTAAWDAAREVAAIAPLPPARPGEGDPWLWLGLGAVVALVAFAAVRAAHRLRAARAARTVAPPVTPPTVVRLPTINSATCIGCHACVDACPYDVLEIRRYVAVVARPADCCGLTLCEQKCPNGSLVMGDGAPAEGQVPVTAALESSEVPGLFLAGDVTGLPLIRNAINQGAHAVNAIADRMPRHDRDLDLVIIGAGPAGLSAALAAKARGLRALTLEQGSVADSIRSFPRGKLVFDQPLDLPLIGPLWLAESTKEELLGRWLRIVRQEELAIREGRRVISIEPGFTVTSIDPDGRHHTARAARVLLAIGRRGSPRRLPIEVPGPMADHVHYSLADARSFAGRKVLVVGLGDVAMETAIALSQQPGTEVTVCYRGADFVRGKARNIAELKRRVASGTIQLLWQSEVSRLEPGRVVVGNRTIPCDSVFVLIGSIPAGDLLGQIVQIAARPGPFNLVEPANRPETHP